MACNRIGGAGGGMANTVQRQGPPRPCFRSCGTPGPVLRQRQWFAMIATHFVTSDMVRLLPAQAVWCLRCVLATASKQGIRPLWLFSRSPPTRASRQQRTDGRGIATDTDALAAAGPAARDARGTPATHCDSMAGGRVSRPGGQPIRDDFGPVNGRAWWVATEPIGSMRSNVMYT